MPEVANQKPVTDRMAQGYHELLSIVTHPAFRLGFLDAQADRPFHHDAIMERIVAETPRRALGRIGWDWPASAFDEVSDFFHRGERRKQAVEIAQYRYEEGRILVKQVGLKCRAWGNPDFPPKAVLDYISLRVSI